MPGSVRECDVDTGVGGYCDLWFVGGDIATAVELSSMSVDDAATMVMGSA